MAWRGDFTNEEWAKLLEITEHITTYVMTASASGTIGTMKEAFAAGSMLIETKDDPDALPLLREIAADATARRDENTAETQSDDNLNRAALLPLIKEAITIINAKAGSDALTIKNWLKRLAITVAEASSEGGFLGIGGKRISAEERIALNELDVIFGIAPAT